MDHPEDMSTIEKVVYLKAWAQRHYNNGHADFMVECWDTADYLEALDDACGDVQEVIDRHRERIEAGRESAGCYDNDDVQWGAEV